MTEYIDRKWPNDHYKVDAEAVREARELAAIHVDPERRVAGSLDYINRRRKAAEAEEAIAQLALEELLDDAQADAERPEYHTNGTTPGSTLGSYVVGDVIRQSHGYQNGHDNGTAPGASAYFEQSGQA